MERPSAFHIKIDLTKNRAENSYYRPKSNEGLFNQYNSPINYRTKKDFDSTDNSTLNKNYGRHSISTASSPQFIKVDNFLNRQN